MQSHIVQLYPDVVVDTMALVLRLENRRMPEFAKAHFGSVEEGASILYIPGMVLAEIGYLSERKRIDCRLSDVRTYIEMFTNVNVCPLSFEIVQTAFSIHDIPELHDRLIAATALHLELRLITNDPVITASTKIKVIW